MMDELSSVFAIVFAAIAIPGIAFVVAARARCARLRGDVTQSEDKAASLLGWLFIALACSFVLLMQLLTAGYSGPGGLGSQGNPLALVVLLVYAFVVAPVSWILLTVFVITWAVARAKQSRS
jgi:hypothetical protein